MINFKLDKLLKKKKLSRYKLEQYTGISLRRINNYFFGDAKTLKVEELDILCKVLECNITDIVEYNKKC